MKKVQQIIYLMLRDNELVYLINTSYRRHHVSPVVIVEQASSKKKVKQEATAASMVTGY